MGRLRVKAHMIMVKARPTGGRVGLEAIGLESRQETLNAAEVGH